MSNVRRAGLIVALVLGLAVAAAGLLGWPHDGWQVYANTGMSVSVTTEDLDEGNPDAGGVTLTLSRPVASGERLSIAYRVGVYDTPTSWEDITVHGNDQALPRGDVRLYSRSLYQGASSTRIRVTAANDDLLNDARNVKVSIRQVRLTQSDSSFVDIIGEERLYTLPIIDDEARPSTPGNLRAVPISQDSVKLTWDASDGGMINGQSQTPRYVYQIDGQWGPNWGAIPGGNVTSHTVTGLDTFDKSYTFRIRAESAAGNSWFTGYVTSDIVPTLIERMRIVEGPMDGVAYTLGDRVRVFVRFTEDITAEAPEDGSVRDVELKLDFDGTVRIARIEVFTPHTLGFYYDVQVGDQAPDGIAIGANSLVLNGVIIQRPSGLPVNLSHDAIPADPDHRVSAPGGL